jgi:signal transduction histidine kinase
VTPLRERVSSRADDIEKVIDGALRDNVLELANREAEFNLFLTRMMIATAILGLLVAFASVFRVRTLERRGEEQHRVTEQAEQEMRRLSHQVVHAQEDERRSISRELHDQVGQMLTGLRMEFRGLAKLYGAPRADFDTRLEQGRILLDQTLQAVRDIAMGLRPSMLDDLGLDAALRWQVREFGRQHDIPVTLNVDADLTNLPEQHRTNLYRIVQEALTNCARHAQASSVTITIGYKNGDLRLVVTDDGIGCTQPVNPGGGLGLIGIQERARELGGSVRLDSSPGRGTSLSVSVPAEWRLGHVRHTSTAG